MDQLLFLQISSLGSYQGEGLLILKYARSLNLSFVYLVPTLIIFSTLWEVHESCYNLRFPQNAPLCSTITIMHQCIFEVFRGLTSLSQSSKCTSIFCHQHFVPYLEYFSIFHRGLSCSFISYIDRRLLIYLGMWIMGPIYCIIFYLF